MHVKEKVLTGISGLQIRVWRSSLKCKPVTRCKKPSYPTRIEVDTHPELLSENLPSGWRKNIAAATSLSILMAAGVGLGACREPAILACVVVTPPAFTTEEEALAIISDELKNAGIVLGGEPVQVNSDALKHILSSPFWGDKPELKGDTPLIADAYDADRGVAIEFVSRSEFNAFYEGDMDLNAQSDTLQPGAPEPKKLDEGDFLGCFFDPTVYPNPLGYSEQDGFKELDWSAKASPEMWESNEYMLRKQVQEFIEWLQGQGVI